VFKHPLSSLLIRVRVILINYNEGNSSKVRDIACNGQSCKKVFASVAQRSGNEAAGIGEKESKPVEDIPVEALRKKGNLFLSFYHSRNYYKHVARGV